MQVDLIEAVKHYLAVFSVPLRPITPPYEELVDFDYGLRRALDPQFDWEDFGRLLLEEDKSPCTLTITEDIFGARYGLFPAPHNPSLRYIAGPWRGTNRTPEQVVWANRYLGPEGAAAVQCYYASIPQLEESTVVGSMAALVSMLYPAGSFHVRRLAECRPLTLKPDTRYFTEPNYLREIPAAMLERRYAAENAYLEAVVRGDAEAALAGLEQFMRFDLGERFTATLRNRKNALIVLNTQLRKAIERADVHPYYLDTISTKYSLKIEAAADDRTLLPLRKEMIREYCDYVQRYSVRQYSPLVQKVINNINLHLASPLSLKKLADEYFISSCYLSRVFRQETGCTLTDYINNQRIQRAIYYLSTTDSSIATIAESVGFLDVNYFSKIFKKVTGSTPTRYRREHRTQ
ncbi:helix-turn-helix domain-containing protein [Gemmiger sp.]|uniref:helix-turn-helix domain-containing protein n=1 Tax=Gemmiger sp. TaxID=2049027 RepID=UPI003EFDE0CF